MRDAYTTGAAKLLVKMDIEGAKYRLLNRMRAHADIMTGLLIELYDVDLHLARIASFVENLPLALIHTHPNHSGSLGLNSVPTVFECTSTAAPVDRARPVSVLSHELDMARQSC